MRITSRQRLQRRGMTLIELLVVVMIVVLLLAVALPLAKPAFKDHKISEASRAVAGYVSGAQARAAEIQRPVGIGIERMHTTMGIVPAAQTANGNATAIRLFLAETPPPYVGDAIGARAYIQEVTTTPPIPSPSIRYYAIYFPGNSPSVNQIVSPGDRIRFDFRGAPYSIVTAPPNPPYNYPVPPSLPGTGTIPRVFIGVPAGDIQPLVSPVPTAASPTASDYSQAGVPYQIYRKPVRSAVAPLELPEGVCIDLTVSGIANTGADFAPHVIDTLTPLVPPNTAPAASNGVDFQPIVIMFTPKGTIGEVWYGATQTGGGPANFGSAIPAGDVFLLIGRTGQVYDYDFPATPSQKAIPDLFYSNEDVQSNLMDLSTIWVAIGAQSGLVKTAENADSSSAPAGQRMIYARQFARSTRELGGR